MFDGGEICPRDPEHNVLIRAWVLKLCKPIVSTEL